MHKMALAEGAVAVALDAAGGQEVRRVRVRVGQLQGILPESWDQCWRMASMETIVEGSQVELVEEPALVRCLGCGREGAPVAPLACPTCGSDLVQVLGGDKIVVEEVELATGEVRCNPEFAQPREGS